MESKPASENRYGIGAVAKMTGLSTHVLRIWERRYSAVVAERADNGRRYYRPADVEKLKLLKALTDRGSAISTVAGLSLDELCERAGEMDRMKAPALGFTPRIAILGAGLSDLLDADTAARNGLEVVAAAPDERRFLQLVEKHQPDTLLLERTTLGDGFTDWLDSLIEHSGARYVVVVHGFSRRADERLLQSRGVCLLRSPINGQQLTAGLVAAVRHGATSHAPAPSRGQGTDDPEAPSPAARRFTPTQLLSLARLENPGIDCECPRHLARLVETLNGFEDYSLECENRDARDAALHARLYRTTARARSLMEEALDELLAFESITP